jgi:hypothetical protein
VTATVRGDAASPYYLVYLNRSLTDVLDGGMFGGLKRWVVERRLKGEAATVLQALQRRLERGGPSVEKR